MGRALRRQRDSAVRLAPRHEQLARAGSPSSGRRPAVSQEGLRAVTPGDQVTPAIPARRRRDPAPPRLAGCLVLFAAVEAGDARGHLDPAEDMREQQRLLPVDALVPERRIEGPPAVIWLAPRSDGRPSPSSRCSRAGRTCSRRPTAGRGRPPADSSGSCTTPPRGSRSARAGRVAALRRSSTFMVATWNWLAPPGWSRK